MKEAAEGFTIVKQGIAFHDQMADEIPSFFYGEQYLRRPFLANGRAGC